MEETLTVTRLGITGKLKLTLQSTNPCESMISTVRVIHRNVKNWSSGEMCLRWTAAGMLEAETRFRKVEGYRGLANLAVDIEADLIRRRNQLHDRADTSPHCVTMHPKGPPPGQKFHDGRDNLVTGCGWSRPCGGPLQRLAFAKLLRIIHWALLQAG